MLVIRNIYIISFSNNFFFFLLDKRERKYSKFYFILYRFYNFSICLVVRKHCINRILFPNKKCIVIIYYRETIHEIRIITLMLLNRHFTAIILITHHRLHRQISSANVNTETNSECTVAWRKKRGEYRQCILSRASQEGTLSPSPMMKVTM